MHAVTRATQSSAEVKTSEPAKVHAAHHITPGAGTVHLRASTVLRADCVTYLEHTAVKSGHAGLACSRISQEQSVQHWRSSGLPAHLQIPICLGVTHKCVHRAFDLGQADESSVQLVERSGQLRDVVGTRTAPDDVLRSERRRLVGARVVSRFSFRHSSFKELAHVSRIPKTWSADAPRYTAASHIGHLFRRHPIGGVAELVPDLA